ncbi:MAG: putative zinc-binding protein [Haloferacaceae archaeon]
MTTERCSSRLGFLVSWFAGPKTTFASFTAGWLPVGYFVVATALTGGVVSLGVRGGIERMARVVMPTVFGVLVALAVYATTLPAWGRAAAFLFTPRSAPSAHCWPSPFSWRSPEVAGRSATDSPRGRDARSPNGTAVESRRRFDGVPTPGASRPLDANGSRHGRERRSGQRFRRAGGNATSMSESYDELPLVYSCSGCSSAAQMANDLAVELDRERLAEMSCIAGVGGDVGPLVDTATSGRPMLVIDGCPLECARKSLERHDVTPNRHVNLAKRGVPKEYHEAYDDERAATLFDELAGELERMEATA